MPSIGDTEKALLQKGFKQSDTHHRYYYLYVDGKRTQVFTYMSHRPSGSDIYTPEAASMKRQMSFDNPAQFREFVRCSMSASQYIEHLREKGILEPEG